MDGVGDQLSAAAHHAVVGERNPKQVTDVSIRARGTGTRTELAALTVAELQALASERGIGGASKLRKGELVDAITENQAGEGSPQPTEQAVTDGSSASPGVTEASEPATVQDEAPAGETVAVRKRVSRRATSADLDANAVIPAGAPRRHDRRRQRAARGRAWSSRTRTTHPRISSRTPRLRTFPSARQPAKPEADDEQGGTSSGSRNRNRNRQGGQQRQSSQDGGRQQGPRQHNNGGQQRVDDDEEQVERSGRNRYRDRTSRPRPAR